MIIAVSGGLGDGKDTFYEFFQKNSPIKFENKKFAYKLKQIVSLLTGCSVDDLEKESFKNSFLSSEWNVDGKPRTYREVLQYMGTEMFRDRFHIDTWVNGLFADYTRDSNFLITDMRFKTEFESVVKKSGITVKVIRKMTTEEWLHSKYFNFLNATNECKDILIGHLGRKEKISKQDFVSTINKCFFLGPNSKNNFDPAYITFIQRFFKITEQNLREFSKYVHPSEIDLNDWLHKFDYVLENDSTLDEFENKVKKFIGDEVGKKF